MGRFVVLVAFVATFVCVFGETVANGEPLSESRTGFGGPYQGGPRRGKGGVGGGYRNLFGLTMYYGNCPVLSRKVVERVDSRYVCQSGGNFECHETCESRFDDDDEEVQGGRCLSPGGRAYGAGYGAGGGYTGYGGVCVCFYCKGMGVSDTKCMEDIEEETLDDDDFEHPLCNVQSNIFNENDDEAVFRSKSSRNRRSADNEARSGGYGGGYGGGYQSGIGYGPIGGAGLRKIGHHPVSSKRCNDKCMLKFINAEKGICKRTHSYKYECVCKTCGDAESFRRNEGNVAGTVDCDDVNPDVGNNVFSVYAPIQRSVQNRLCETRLRQGDGVDPDACTASCLKNFMHNPVKEGRCIDDPHDDAAQRCVCDLCLYPRCVYDTWNDWSYCSTRCNGGTRRRKRNLITGNKNDCTDLINYRACNEYPCPVDCVVAPWGEWSYCHGYCGSGRQARERQVLVPPLYGGKCSIYEFVQHSPCDTGRPCEPQYGPQYGPDGPLNGPQNGPGPLQDQYGPDQYGPQQGPNYPANNAYTA